jgi:predicted metal-binding membrane protein
MNRPIEWIARHERIVVMAALGVVVVLAWGLLLTRTGVDMPDDGMAEHAAHGGALGRFLAVFVMWAVMMVAMMLPSAAPVILLFAALMRARAPSSPLLRAAIFASGYVLVWGVFSLVATLAHMALEHAALLSSAMRTRSAILAGMLLVAAGVYQFTPLKDACLRQCRSPIQFLTRHWRTGLGGALRLGLFHGVYCVGCCWALMGLLFVGGVMNVAWVAVLAVFVLLEKTAVLGTRVGRAVSGAGLVAAGAVAIAIR